MKTTRLNGAPDWTARVLRQVPQALAERFLPAQVTVYRYDAMLKQHSTKQQTRNHIRKELSYE